MRTKIFRRLLLAAGVAIVALALSTPVDVHRADAAPRSSAQTSSGDTQRTQRDKLQAAHLNPLGLPGFVPIEDSETYTENESDSRVDAQVGAGANETLGVPNSTAEHKKGTDWLVQGLLIFLFLAVASIGIRLILYPAERPWRTQLSSGHPIQ